MISAEEMGMEVRQIFENKKDYLSLLLLADEQEDMIERYLDAGDLFVLFDPDPVAECVVVDLGEGTFEIKNIATAPARQGQGYGRAMIEFALAHYKGHAKEWFVGTGDSPLTIPFYQKCGFQEHHRIPDFFTNHYDHPIIEAGVLLKDMVYLRREAE